MPRALVAGGAGNIGRAIVAVLVERGYSVTVADLVAAPSSVSERIERSIVVDLATEHGAQEAIRVAAADDGLDVVISCMGISPKKDGRKRPLEEIDLDEWERVFAVNVTSPFLLTKAAMPVLTRHANASIVNIVSVVARLGASGPDGTSFGHHHPAGAHYCASKAAFTSLTVSTARELAVHGIRCNGVAPGYIGSGMGDETASDLERQILAQVPLERSGKADEVAGVVGFLVSPDSSYITGEIIDVDGGWAPG